VLAPAQALANVTIWSHCLECHAKPLAEPAEHSVPESLRALTAQRDGCGSYADESGAPMLAAWTMLDLGMQI
jgi:hypothetical protein